MRMLERAVAIAAILLLGACESFGDLNSDTFDPGRATQSAFALDSAQCRARAEDRQDYNGTAVDASDEEWHEMFNQAYAACMQADGYVRRDWSPTIPVPYDVRWPF